MTVVTGVVEHGDARGRTLGFPTANVALPRGGTESRIEDGVWAARVLTGTGEWAAAVSVGRRRTFYAGEGPRLLEAHLLDFDGDLYGRTVRVELIGRLRGQRTFATPDDLVAQLHRDVAGARQWAAVNSPGTLVRRDSRVPERTAA